MSRNGFHWHCRHSWRKSAKNTGWCILGCAIGDFGTILYFQVFIPDTPAMLVMGLAMMNGLLTSIALETFILSRQMDIAKAFNTAIGMSFISMLAMEIAMNSTDYLLVGEASLRWWSVPPALLMGFLVPWPYNYWRLKRHNRSCH